MQINEESTDPDGNNASEREDDDDNNNRVSSFKLRFRV